jgi:PKHD-type hydroxylase
MFLKIKNLLTDPECERLTALAGELRFVDGRVSNPANVSKQNLQADTEDPKYAESVQIVGTAFARSREFGSFALPKRIAPPLLCRYEPGMKYGGHADAAIIQLPKVKLRSDLSCTVFIGDPGRLIVGQQGEGLLLGFGCLSIERDIIRFPGLLGI